MQVVFLAEDGKSFQADFGHVVRGDVRIGLHGDEAVYPSEEKGSRGIVFVEGSVTEFGHGQSVSVVVGLFGLFLGVEPYQSLIGTHPEIAAVVFQDTVYGAVGVELCADAVRVSIFVWVETEKPRTGAQPVALLVFVYGEHVVGGLAVHQVVEAEGDCLSGTHVNAVGSKSSVSEPQHGVAFTVGGEKVI